MKVGILGGTGPAGSGLAARLASAGVATLIGSRAQDRAEEACAAIRARWPHLSLPLEAGDNIAAAAADVVVLATPWEAAAPTAAALAKHLDGKVLISMANALTKVGKEFVALATPRGSVAAHVQSAAPGALVAAAFHHLPARSLSQLDEPMVGDVLVCADHPQAWEATAALVDAMADLRALHAGSLSSAGAVEAMTAVLLQLNTRYRARASIRLTGITAPGA